MLFNSYIFIFLFLPLTFFTYFYLLNKRLIVGAKGFLVFASLFFYSWWNISYLPLILSSMLFNYVVGNSLNGNFKKRKIGKKKLLTFGIIINVALLAYFKYSDFFITNFNIVFNSKIPLLNLALPLAISFFTFQQIAYLVDSYYHKTKEYDFLNYALFVTFFPQLIAGPIVHHSEMMPQFANKFNLIKKYKNIALGLLIFSIGLFKKVVIADYFASFATNGFDIAKNLNFVEAWITSLSYTVQLYFDFSGYTDMAIGIALLFNIKLPINFNSPYKATSIQDFWRRWHITLSRFLRDYIYIPLGGNRISEISTYKNLLATFIIGGLWHGAGWTFVFWGFLHGIALIINRFWQKLNLKLPKILAWFITFNFVNMTWVFFRAKEWDDAIKVLSGMIGINKIVINKSFKLEFISSKFINFSEVFTNTILTQNSLVLLIIVLFIALLAPNTSTLKINSLSSKYWLLTAMLLAVDFLYLQKPSEFLYFNF